MGIILLILLSLAGRIGAYPWCKWQEYGMLENIEPELDTPVYDNITIYQSWIKNHFLLNVEYAHQMIITAGLDEIVQTIKRWPM